MSFRSRHTRIYTSRLLYTVFMLFFSANVVIYALGVTTTFYSNEMALDMNAYAFYQLDDTNAQTVSTTFDLK